jgi:hypothetical protein
VDIEFANDTTTGEPILDSTNWHYSATLVASRCMETYSHKLILVREMIVFKMITRKRAYANELSEALSTSINGNKNASKMEI